MALMGKSQSQRTELEPPRCGARVLFLKEGPCGLAK